MDLHQWTIFVLAVVSIFQWIAIYIVYSRCNSIERVLELVVGEIAITNGAQKNEHHL